ncbi:MAG: transposase, partial [Phycisphaerae bacterium]
SIANNPEIKEGMSRKAIDAAIAKYADQETLYDQPFIDKSRARVSGPFTVEAVPAPAVMSISDASRDACGTGTVAQASSLPEETRRIEAPEDADRMSALRRPELLSGTHGRGYLPHWKSEGATYFVTFRLAGTLPKSVLDELDAERAALADRTRRSGKSLTKADQRRLSELHSEKIDAYLDAGRGDCWLTRPEVGQIVADALQHFAGQRYELHAWTIMPNHVHVVITPSEKHTLSDILHSWKSYTATKANKLLDRSGQPFWQRESYDHLVRDEKDYQRVCEYTINNPVAAGLCVRPEDWAYGSAGVAQASSLQRKTTESDQSRQDACATWTADSSVGRSCETLRQDEWRDELLKCGIRGKKKQHIHFSRVETLSGTRWLHADAETTGDTPERVVVSFGPEHAPLEQRQVEQALEEAQLLKPTPRMVVFASFQFDPEAAKDIDETHWPGMTLLKVQMNTDLLTDDLKKKRSSNESFWMIGQPDVQVRRYVAQASSLPQAQTDDSRQDACATLWQVEVCGFDYYNPVDGKIESGDTSRIAMWMLDTDYDGRSLYPSQVFFPMAGAKDGWARLAKNLKAEIDEELIEAYRGTISLPFEPGDHQRVAVKIIDDRGIESLKIVGVA